MRLIHIVVRAALALVVGGASAIAADPPSKVANEHDDLVRATLLVDTDAIAPGSSLTLGLHLKMKPHWHTYWINPGESGEATKVKMKGPAGVTFGEVQWPLPQKIVSFDAITYGYENEVMLLVPVKIAKDAKLEGAIEAHVTWLACHDTCIEGEAKLSLALPAKSSASHKETFDAWRSKLPIDQEDKHSPIVHVKQPINRKTEPMPSFTIEWKEAPAKVDFFPVATRAVAIENVTVKHEGTKTVVTFKQQVFKPEQVPGGRVYGVAIIEDAKGVRRGVVVPFKVDTTEE